MIEFHVNVRDQTRTHESGHGRRVSAHGRRVSGHVTNYRENVHDRDHERNVEYHSDLVLDRLETVSDRLWSGRRGGRRHRRENGRDERHRVETRRCRLNSR